VSGNFSGKIVRLNADGSQDQSFTQPADWPAVITDAALVAGNKIVLVGNFTDYLGTSVSHIVRLNGDGTVDNSFSPGTGADNTIDRILAQPDGKLLICGSFSNYNGSARSGIARLNADGSLDNTFDPGTGATGVASWVTTMALQADGKVLIAGFFSSFNGNQANGFARINADGTFDAGFTIPNINGGTASSRAINDIDVLPDGKILIGGHFETVAGQASASVARLNSDGTVDASFNPGTGAQLTFGTGVLAMHVLPNGKILVGGKFNTFDGQNRKGIAGLNADGSLDASFDPGTGIVDFLPYGLVNHFALQADGKVIIGGDFDEYNGTERFNIARLQGSGPVSSIQEETNENSLKVYPNPSQGILKVEHHTENATLRLLDLQGRVLISTPVSKGSFELDASKFPKGVYVIQVSSPTGNSYQRLVLE
jgi:uncharacterized delta-60 repeat protein